MLSGAFYGTNGIKYDSTTFTEENVDRLNNVVESEDNIVYHSVLLQQGKHCEGFLTHEQFQWDISFTHPTTRKQKTIHHTIDLKDVLNAHYERSFRQKSSNEIELFPTQYFSVHYCRKAKSNKLKYHHVVFQTVDCETCQCWVDNIKASLKKFSRPEKLLVFINPVGGKKEAEKIFHSKVAPLFSIAKINYDIIVTERMNHAKDYLQSEDISLYDGVISVGGDGMFSEVMNGVLSCSGDGTHQVLPSKTTTTSGTTVGSSRQESSIKLGIIPAGSTDTVIYCTTGCNDPATAALQIILGDELPMDVCSVWHEGDFLKYSISLMAYGYFGDIIKESEKLRWIGPKRYDFAGFKRFMVNKSYQGEITFCSTNKPEMTSQPEQCKQGCKRCSTFVEGENESEITSGEWRTIRGRFISVFGANISCRCAKSSTGISPHAHIGDGEIDLVLVRKTTRANYLHHLIKVSERTTEHFDFNFIEVHRVKEFHFKPLGKTITPLNTIASGDGGESSMTRSDSADSFESSSSTSSNNDTSVWNIDGELVETPNLQFKVHRQLIRVYARGIEE